MYFFASPPSNSVNVNTFGADPTGATDSTTAINAAIAAAAAQSPAPFGPHGGTVIFPPGKYSVSGPLKNVALGTDVQLVGSGRTATFIVGTFAGFIIDQNDGSNGGPTTGSFSLIEGLDIQNGFLKVTPGYDPTIGTIRYNGGLTAGTIRQCTLSGWNCIVSNSNDFNTRIEGCDISAPGVYLGTVGIVGGGQVVENCSIFGCWVGMSLKGTGITSLVGYHAEDCQYAAIIGQDETGSASFASPTSIDGFITEACNNSLYIINGQCVAVNAARATGTIGAPYPITTATWSAGTGLATVTVPALAPLDSIGWTVNGTTKPITISSLTAWSLLNVWVTGTRTSSTTFTYPTTDPGVVWSSGSWSTKQQTGFYLVGASNLVMNGCVCNINGTNIGTGGSGFDLFTPGNDTNPNNVLVGCTAGSAGWAMPKSTSKAGWQYISCDQPAGTTLDVLGVRQAGMNFADLPGQTSVIVTTPIEGMEYNITDGAKSGGGSALFADIVVGGGSQHIKVRYDGTNWRRCG